MTKSVREKHSGGRFLSKDDIPGDWHKNGLILTVDRFDEENVAREDQRPETKPILHFEEADAKPMVLNKGNNKLTLKWWPSDAASKGQQVLVYVNPEVTDQNDKVVGGLRLGRPSEKQTDQPEPEPDNTGHKSRADASEPSDDIPF